MFFWGQFPVKAITSTASPGHKGKKFLKKVCERNPIKNAVIKRRVWE
jgi:hypothetical protein